MSITFLIASERSGSNLITKMLNSHSKICGPTTKHVINPVVRNLFRYAPIAEPKNWEALVNDINHILGIDFSFWKKKFTTDELLSLAPVGDINTLLKTIFYEEAKLHGKESVFIKENHIYEFLPYLLVNFPDAKYVHLVRDPRDMALSWKKSPVHVGGVVKGALQWQKDEQNSLKHFFVLDSINKGLLIRYEDLIADPSNKMEEIVNFLGFEYEKQMMQFHADKLTQKNAGNQKAWENLSKGLMTNNKEKYKKELTDKEILLIEKICYYEMKHLGYEPNNPLEELNVISQKDITHFDEKETSEIEVLRPKGVVQNIEAKKIFYQKLLS